MPFGRRGEGSSRFKGIECTTQTVRITEQQQSIVFICIVYMVYIGSYGTRGGGYPYHNYNSNTSLYKI